MQSKQHQFCVLAICLVVIPLLSVDVLAQRGGRGGRGGGGSRGGGFSGGGSSAYSRSPSMSRSSSSMQTRSAPSRTTASPSMNRSTPSRTGTANRGPGGLNSANAANRGNAGNRSPQGNRAAGGSPGQSAYRAPSQNQLNNFLNMPSQPAAGGRSTTAGQPNSRTREGERGGSIDVSGGRTSGETQGGINYGAGGMQVTVTGPGGNSKTTTRGAAGATDGTNTVGGAGRRTDVEGAAGGSASAGRSVRGATDGTNSAVAGRAGVGYETASGFSRGAAAGGVRATDGVNSYARGGSVRAAQNPMGTTVVHGRGAAAYNGVVVGGRQAVAVRTNYRGYGRYYTRGWYARYPRAWVAAGITSAAWWAGAAWGSASSYCGCDSSSAVAYDYGESIYIDEGVVYDGDQPIADAEEFVEEAADLAASGAVPVDDQGDWLPLGVFAIVTEGQTTAERSIQLAINPDGIVRGNLVDELTENVEPIEGALDKETQRVAIRFPSDAAVIAETGLYDLTQDTATVLIHRGTEKVQTRGLVRLSPPEDTQTPPAQ